MQKQKRVRASLKESNKKYSCTENCQPYPHQKTHWPGGGRDGRRCLSSVNSPAHTCASRRHLLLMRECFPWQGTQSAMRDHTFCQNRLICRFFYRKTFKNCDSTCSAVLIFTMYVFMYIIHCAINPE